MLEKETRHGEEAEKAKTNLTTKLIALREYMVKAALREHMVKAKAYTVAKYRVSQPFFDACDIYYGDVFDDCLKQVGAAFPDLDLSQITIDDTVSEEAGDSVHTIEQGAKDADIESVVQSAPERLETLAIQSFAVPSTEDGPSPAGGPSPMGSSAS